MGGETIPQAHVHSMGMAGDRCWAVLDAATGDICSAKKIPRLLNLHAQFVTEPGDQIVYGEEVAGVSIRFPDGRVAASQEEASELISKYLGQPIRLHPLESPQNSQHYRLNKPLDDAELARMLGVQPGQDGPDFSGYDPEMIALLGEYACPPGTYYDVFPLHLLTTASLDHMSEVSGTLFDCRRFRPSLLVETAPGIDGLAEFDWVGKNLRIGEVQLRIESRTIRCSMPAREQIQLNLDQNPAIAESIYQTTNRFLGVNVTVLKSGCLKVGESIELIERS
jgi:uncharacterized protein YcbX